MDLAELFEAATPGVLGFMLKPKIPPKGEEPEFPKIFGTGFFVSEDGLAVTNRHVIEYYQQIPRIEKTGEDPVGVVVCLPEKAGRGWQVLGLQIKGFTYLDTFGSSPPNNWFGEPVPDIGLVQIAVRDVRSLKLAAEKNYLKIGMPVATIGYPMGDVPLKVFGKLNQVTPFLRHGIVSSVFPHPAAFPHGFTIDIMQQGGSSGSPIFQEGDATVVGMMASSVLEWKTVRNEQLAFAVAQNTNISIAIPGHVIKGAVDDFLNTHKLDIEGVQTLNEMIEESEKRAEAGPDQMI